MNSTEDSITPIVREIEETLTHGTPGFRRKHGLKQNDRKGAEGPMKSDERKIKMAAMSIVNYTLETAGVGVDTRQAINDRCDAFAVSELSALCIEGNDRLSRIADALLNHCDKDGGECMECSRIVCPHQEPLHFHHDGCPSCSVDESEADSVSTDGKVMSPLISKESSAASLELKEPREAAGSSDEARYFDRFLYSINSKHCEWMEFPEQAGTKEYAERSAKWLSAAFWPRELYTAVESAGWWYAEKASSGEAQEKKEEKDL